MMKTVAAVCTGVAAAAGALSLTLSDPPAARATDACSHNPGPDDECEVLVEYYSYDFCMKGGDQDLTDEDYRGYRYFDCVQTASGSWHILLHNG